jgi:misacylated tRNA(Ala) deacylase
LEAAAIALARIRNGKLVHSLASPGPEAGDEVTGTIDWDRRLLLMRTHTALHILCGVVWRDYGAKVTGGDMRPGEARMDFELEQMSAKFAEEIEEKVNAEVSAARDVLVDSLARENADRNPDLIRTKINLLPAGIRHVRTIDIRGLDLQADGGTHVANTQEVGAIRVVGHESKGRINKRLRIGLDA